MKIIHDGESIIEIGDADTSRFEGRFPIEKGDFDIPEHEELKELKWNGSEVIKRPKDDPFLQEQREKEQARKDIEQARQEWIDAKMDGNQQKIKEAKQKRRNAKKKLK